MAASLGALRLQPELTTVPLHGVDPGHVVLATRADDRDRLVAAFRKCAHTHLAAARDRPRGTTVAAGAEPVEDRGDGSPRAEAARDG